MKDNLRKAKPALICLEGFHAHQHGKDGAPDHDVGVVENYSNKNSNENRNDVQYINTVVIGI